MRWFKRDTKSRSTWRPTAAEEEQIRADLQRQVGELAERYYDVVLDNGQEVFIEITAAEIELTRLDLTWN